jgi:hypothetical protein
MKDKKEVIYAMAFSRQKALEKLDDLSLPVSEHIFKLLILSKHQSVPHWKQELKNWRKALSRYNVSKAKSPNYNKVTLKKYLYQDPLGTTADRELLHQIIKTDYDINFKLPANLEKKLENFVTIYIESILKNNDNWML